MQYTSERKLTGVAAIALALALTLAAWCLASVLQTEDDTPLAGVNRLNVPANREVQVCGGNVFFLDGSKLHCINSSGRYVWNISFEQNCEFDVNEYGVTMWQRANLKAASTATGLDYFTAKLENNIFAARTGDRYVAAAIGEENNCQVVILNLNGGVVDTLSGFQGYTLLDFGFFAGRDLFWIMMLDSTGSVPTCRISTYIPGKRETGSITDSEQVLYEVMFRSSFIQAVGTNYMRLYDYTGAEQTKERTAVYGWYLEDVDKSTDNPLMLFVPNGQVDDDIRISDVRMIRGSTECIIHLPVTCRQLIAAGSNFYGFSREHLVKGSFGQKTSTVYRLPVTVDNVIGITSDNTAVVTSTGSIYLMKLP